MKTQKYDLQTDGRTGVGARDTCVSKRGKSGNFVKPGVGLEEGMLFKRFSMYYA